MMKTNHTKCIIVFSLFCTWMFGGMSTSQGQKRVRNRPSVYITFQGFVRTVSSEQPHVRLVLHNNTRWVIHYGEWLERVFSGGDAAIIYAVELKNGCLGGRGHTSVVTTGKLLPGRSISFLVPFEDFPKGSAIFLEFDYSWELIKGNRDRNEAVHRAYFLASDLPRWLDSEPP